MTYNVIRERIVLVVILMVLLGSLFGFLAALLFTGGFVTFAWLVVFFLVGMLTIKISSLLALSSDESFLVVRRLFLPEKIDMRQISRIMISGSFVKLTTLNKKTVKFSKYRENIEDLMALLLEKSSGVMITGDYAGLIKKNRILSQRSLVAVLIAPFCVGIFMLLIPLIDKLVIMMDFGIDKFNDGLTMVNSKIGLLSNGEILSVKWEIVRGILFLACISILGLVVTGVFLFFRRVFRGIKRK